MTTIYLCSDAYVSSYSAAVKGTEAVVTVKIKITDSYALGYLLRDLERSKQEGAEERRATAAAKAAAARKRPAASSPALEHQETRLLPYFGGERS